MEISNCIVKGMERQTLFMIKGQFWSLNFYHCFITVEENYNTLLSEIFEKVL
jgi:hypothetical protein